METCMCNTYELFIMVRNVSKVKYLKQSVAVFTWKLVKRKKKSRIDSVTVGSIDNMYR